MTAAAVHTALPVVERRLKARYRVTVHMDGEAWFYEHFPDNGAAMDYQRQMRDIYRRAGLPVFVKRERIIEQQKSLPICVDA